MASVEEYLDGLEATQKAELEKIRAIVKKNVPSAEECISYGIPSFKVHGKYLFGYAAFKNHLSVFPTPVPIEEIKEKLDQYKISKGTIQFTKENPISEALIKQMLEIQLQRIEES